MHILFPSLPSAPAAPDPDYEAEYEAARVTGFSCALYELESLRAGDLRGSLRYCPAAPAAGEPLLYRGWMLSDTQYASLYGALVKRGYQPLTTPEAYAEAHYLPLAYDHLRGQTPETVWMDGDDVGRAWELYGQVSDAPAILKDFVKSAKHRWREACYLPAHTTRPDFERTLAAFLYERGSLFEKGLVLRRYHPLVELGQNMQGQPIHEEYRLFCFDGVIIAHAPFRDPSALDANRGLWQDLAVRFANRFVTLDVAAQEDGSWLVVEAGDGGVSGLPLSIEPDAFYTALYRACAQA